VTIQRDRPSNPFGFCTRWLADPLMGLPGRLARIPVAKKFARLDTLNERPLLGNRRKVTDRSPASLTFRPAQLASGRFVEAVQRVMRQAAAGAPRGDGVGSTGSPGLAQC